MERAREEAKVWYQMTPKALRGRQPDLYPSRFRLRRAWFAEILGVELAVGARVRLHHQALPSIFAVLPGQDAAL